MSRSTTQLILNRAARIKSAAGEFTRLKTAKQEWMRPGGGMDSTPYTVDTTLVTADTTTRTADMTSASVTPYTVDTTLVTADTTTYTADMEAA